MSASSFGKFYIDINKMLLNQAKGPLFFIKGGDINRIETEMG